MAASRSPDALTTTGTCSLGSTRQLCGYSQRPRRMPIARSALAACARMYLPHMNLVLEQCRSHCSTEWTAANSAGQTHRMLPWNSIERLRDHFGDYVIVVPCRTCRHAREMSPAFLARHCRRGWDEPLATVIARLRCRCG